MAAALDQIAAERARDAAETAPLERATGWAGGSSGESFQ
jgi:hypothetical protein